MTLWNFKNWKVGLLLSIVLPVGMLTAFKTTGLMQEPMIVSEIVTTDAATWNMTRPSTHFRFENSIVNVFSTATFSANLTVYLWLYDESDPDIGFNDDLSVIITASSKTTMGVIHSMQLTFSKTDEYSLVDINLDSSCIELRNLTQQKVYDGREALYETIAAKETTDGGFRLRRLLWIFFDHNNIDHWITITLAITYFDGSIYRQVLIPARLGVTVS